MSNLNNRIKRLEEKQPAQELPAWAEILDDNSVILRMNDGRRIEATLADIPCGAKCYAGISPDDWNEARPIDYRAGIVPGVKDAPGAIPLRIVDMPTNKTGE